MNQKALIQSAFQSVFENDDFSEDIIAQYFHPDYTQTVDGKVLNYDQFVEHMKHLKSAVSAVKIEFQQLVAEGNAVCSLHLASGKKDDGTMIKAKVIAYFEIKDGLIVACDELTHLIQGNEEDQDLGSRH